MANLEGISVSAYIKEGTGDDVEWKYVSAVDTDVDGIFSIDGLRPGTYRLKYNDPDGDYQTEYYDDGDTLDQATDIVVGDGVTVTGKGAALADAGHITGTVTDE